jgi:hypothetical protein
LPNPQELAVTHTHSDFFLFYFIFLLPLSLFPPLTPLYFALAHPNCPSKAPRHVLDTLLPWPVLEWSRATSRLVKIRKRGKQRNRKKEHNKSQNGAKRHLAPDYTPPGSRFQLSKHPELGLLLSSNLTFPAWPVPRVSHPTPGFPKVTLLRPIEAFPFSWPPTLDIAPPSCLVLLLPLSVHHRLSPGCFLLKGNSSSHPRFVYCEISFFVFGFCSGRYIALLANQTQHQLLTSSVFCLPTYLTCLHQPTADILVPAASLDTAHARRFVLE